MGEREGLGEGTQPRRQRCDREQRAGEEPRDDGDGRQGAHVLLLLANTVGEGLGGSVHDDGETKRGGHEPGDAAGPCVERRPPEHGGPHERPQLEGAHRQGDGEVAEHDERPGHRRGQQITPGAALPVDDHADAGEHAVDGNEEPHGPDGHEAHVVDAPDGTRHLGQRRGDDDAEQDRRHEGDDDLAGRPGGEGEAAPGQRGQRREQRGLRRVRRRQGRGRRGGRDGGHEVSWRVRRRGGRR